jgi:DNA-directed RNA polymerase subunit RPC12/RpoP
MDSIRVKCKVCGRDARSDEFVLDPVYKKMVCPYCVTDRRTRENVHKQVMEERLAAKDVEQKAKNKPVGWDKDDEYLERAHKARQDNKVKVEKIDNVFVKYTCHKCGYQFKFNTDKMMPVHCPYCSEHIKDF